MAEDRFQRFRRLERPRPTGQPDPPERGSATEERFEALEDRKEAGAESPQVAGGHLDRFRPAAERPLDVAPAVEEGALPFVRCAACQMDHNRSATLCSNCGADLRTGEQRAFNARLAEERRAQAAVEAAQVAELERAQRDAQEEAARAQRAMAETLAREVGDAERRRLDMEMLGDFGAPPGGGWGRPGWGRRGRGFGLLGWIVEALLRLVFGRRDWP